MPVSQVHFGDRLANAVQAKRTPLMVGLDPRWENLPEPIRRSADAKNRASVAQAFGHFCREVIDVVAPLVPAIKPQWAFFEQLGHSGIAELEAIVDYAHQHELLVVADAKRGDIGSTSEAYAEAFFRLDSGRPFCDALTVNPYLGMDSWQPFVKTANARGGGIFVLVKTSNPGSADLQDVVADGKKMYQRVADQIEQVNQSLRGESGYGPVGAVVGATHPRELSELRDQMPSTWILVPGFGAQGGSAQDAIRALDSRGWGGLINSSRAIIFAYEQPAYRPLAADGRWQSAVEHAARDAIEQLRGPRAM